MQTTLDFCERFGLFLDQNLRETGRDIQNQFKNIEKTKTNKKKRRNNMPEKGLKDLPRGRKRARPVEQGQEDTMKTPICAQNQQKVHKWTHFESILFFRHIFVSFLPVFIGNWAREMGMHSVTAITKYACPLTRAGKP